MELYQVKQMNLIGISGKIGSGKDTVFEIIQKLCLTNNGPSWENKKFADKLKQIASILTGISVDNFEDQEFKKVILGPEWGKETKSNSLNTTEPFVEMMSVRELLQKLGTEVMRNSLHQNVWVNALFADYKCVPADRAPNGWDCDNWIITDMRFPNEYKAIKDKGGITIRVNRPGHGKSMTDLASAHPSETALDGFEFDYTINNDGDLEKLISLVRDILEKENII